jgi:putative IMPACT (imprinted ancient) family translation regulator
MKEYNEASAKVLRQPALVSFIQARVNDVSPELREEPLVKTVTQQLSDIQKLVTFSGTGTPTAEDVQKLNGAVSKLMEDIQQKPEAK